MKNVGDYHVLSMKNAMYYHNVPVKNVVLRFG